MTSETTVFLVDADQTTRNVLVALLENQGYTVRAASSPKEMLERYDADKPGCLILDQSLAGMTGLQFRNVLFEKGSQHPFIIISKSPELAVALEAMRNGAVDFLEKPICHSYFLRCVEKAVYHDAIARQRQIEQNEIKQRMEELTPREREVMQLVVAGKLTKQIAKQLGISTKTVEVHRSQVTRKMRVNSIAQLVSMVCRYTMTATHTVLEQSATGVGQLPLLARSAA